MSTPTEADLNDELLSQHKRAAGLTAYLAFNASEDHRRMLMQVEERIGLLKLSLSHVQAAQNIESMKRVAAAIQDHIDRTTDNDSGDSE